MNALRWRLIFIAVLTLWAAYYVSPSIIYFASPKELRNNPDAFQAQLPDWIPQKHVKLGLDLQGGVQLVLGVSVKEAVDNKLDRVGTEAARWSQDQGKKVKEAYGIKNEQRLKIVLEDGADVAAFRKDFGEEFPGLEMIDRDGMTLEYGYDENQIKQIEQSAIQQAERVIRNRIDKWGVSEPVINRRIADNSILVQLPGFKDPSKAKDLLGRTAQLHFKIVDDDFTGFTAVGDMPPGITKTTAGGQTAFQGEDKDALLEFARGKVPEGREVYVERELLAGGKKSRFTTYVTRAAAEINGEDILDAFYTESSDGLTASPEVSLRFTGPGGKRFADVTGANVGKRMAIILDGEVVSAPVIQGRIPGGNARITLGSGRSRQEMMEEANELSLILKSGALPATIEVLEERQVGASLGPELANQGVKGALLGLLLVLGFMVVYYRRPGMLSGTALLLNGLFLLAAMASFGFALTLPGIAGFILTLGMAVDANVLINERIREELAEGKNAKKAVENGFGKVIWTIIDANVTTLIAALVLLETNSSGPIRGFAITLILGILVSMFTSLYCTRTFFELVVAKSRTDAAVRAWLGGKAAELRLRLNFNFLRRGPMAAMIGAAVVVAVIGVSSVRGLNWGVDFAGGTEMLLGFNEPVDVSNLKATAEKVGIRDVTVQVVGDERKQYLLRFEKQDEAATSGASEALLVQNLKDEVATSFASAAPEILQVDYVGPQIGKELRTQGILSVLYAIIGVLLYIALRFDMRFGPGAVVKMLLDIFVILGFYAFFWRSFDLTSVAAFLTVVGYSVNDTIVIYDRIRENLTTHPKRSMADNINGALNDTLSRSINTSITTFVALTGLLIFGSGQIWNFAAAMAVGVVAATLSSQFLASSFVLWFANWKKQRGSRAVTPSTQAPAGAR